MTETGAVIDRLCDMLLSERNEHGIWPGELSSSALSTATSVFALASVDREMYEPYIRSGMEWLVNNRNRDGGWGDTGLCKSNLSTTLLVYSAMTASPPENDVIDSCERYIKNITGSLDPRDIVRAVLKAYGSDRTFSIPILTMCALAGRLGKDGWKYVEGLPFELAVFPQEMFRWLRLPVVSYALPALIAIGQAGFYKRPPLNPLKRIARKLSCAKTLDVLSKIQPVNGGFLEAAPLTGFVLMSLAGCGHKDHIVSKKAVRFLLAGRRPDGSWPIDTNLATWLTTMSVQALGAESLGESSRKSILTWLLNQQHRKTHPYTKADPGGWAWTDLPGGVPDADDTPGALLAVKLLDPDAGHSCDAAEAAVSWLIRLQNRDGGIPTFCSGRGKLPFDKSCTDLTAHALAAWSIWKPFMKPVLKKSMKKAIKKGLAFIRKAQRHDGAWVPLWFGNEHVKDMNNPVYGTAKVLSYLTRMKADEISSMKDSLEKGLKWLINAQKEDGTWGGDEKAPSSIEETALALDAVASCAGLELIFSDFSGLIKNTLLKGRNTLIEITEKHDTLPASPIGLYFARLWYYEKLYPLIFSLSALRKIRQVI